MISSASRTFTRVFAIFLLATGSIVSLFGTTVGAQSAEDDPAQVEAGMAVYESNCAGCHGADGTGSPAGRPLLGIAAQEADRAVHFASVTDGKGNMPGFSDRLSPEEVDAVVSFVRLTFVAADAAPVAEEPAELPRTGAESNTLVLAGIAMLLTGTIALRFERRLQN